MTDAERSLLVLKCGKLLQDVLVEIRNLTLAEGNARRVNDLADLTHNIPQFMVGRDDHVLACLRAGFVAYARKHAPEIDPEKSRYVRLIDMDEETFNELYSPAGWTWPEPAEVAK